MNRRRRLDAIVPLVSGLTQSLKRLEDNRPADDDDGARIAFGGRSDDEPDGRSFGAAQQLDDVAHFCAMHVMIVDLQNQIAGPSASALHWPTPKHGGNPRIFRRVVVSKRNARTDVTISLK